MQANTNQIINISSMCELIGKQRTTLYIWVRDGYFPQPLRINGRTIGWHPQQYQQWLESLIVEAK